MKESFPTWIRFHLCNLLINEATEVSIDLLTYNNELMKDLIFEHFTETNSLSNLCPFFLSLFQSQVENESGLKDYLVNIGNHAIHSNLEDLLSFMNELNGMASEAISHSLRIISKNAVKFFVGNEKMDYVGKFVRFFFQVSFTFIFLLFFITKLIPLLF